MEEEPIVMGGGDEDPNPGAGEDLWFIYSSYILI